MLRDVLDKHSSTIQTANLQRTRQYDDEIQHLDQRNLPDAPSWSYIDQEDSELDSYYNYNTKDRTDREEAESRTGEEVEGRTNKKTGEVAEDEEADYEVADDRI